MAAIDTLSRIAWNWGVRSFGFEHMTDEKVRSFRLAEEAIETAQACDVPEEQMHLLVSTVYKRARGDLGQELGGVAVTLGVLALKAGTSIEAVMEREVQRVLTKTPEHFAKRNAEKIALGLTGYT